MFRLRKPSWEGMGVRFKSTTATMLTTQSLVRFAANIDCYVIMCRMVGGDFPCNRSPRGTLFLSSAGPGVRTCGLICLCLFLKPGYVVSTCFFFFKNRPKVWRHLFFRSHFVISPKNMSECMVSSVLFLLQMNQGSWSSCLRGATPWVWTITTRRCSTPSPRYTTTRTTSRWALTRRCCACCRSLSACFTWRSVICSRVLPVYQHGPVLHPLRSSTYAVYQTMATRKNVNLTQAHTIWTKRLL